MFVSHKFGFVFFEVPRTGSNSISQVLMEIDPQSPTAIKRTGEQAVLDYHAFRIPDDAKEYHIVAAHRNPYERLWSHWKHRRKHGNPSVFKDVSWAEYVDWVCKPDTASRIKGAILDRPICEMPNIDRVTHWLRFSHLNDDWVALCRELDIPVRELNQLNSSAKFVQGGSGYSEIIADRVYQHFQCDFERFDYARDSWQKNSIITNKDPIESHKPTTPQSKRQPNAKAVESSQTASTTAITGLPKVAILTNFQKSDPAYSLNRVVQNQISMLLAHGYTVRALVVASASWETPQDNFSLPGVELVQLPYFSPKLRKQLDESDIVEQLSAAIHSALQGIDVVIAHDLIYQPGLSATCDAALSVAQSTPTTKWLHWIHSATSLVELFEANDKTPGAGQRIASWPNAYPICFNHLSKIRIADNFQCSESQVKVVPHPIDIVKFLALSEFTAELYNAAQLHQADFITTLPVRLDRGKQVEWAVKIMAQLKLGGDSVRLIVMDFHSQDQEKSAYREEIKMIAQDWGLDKTDFIFLSEYDEKSKRTSPHSIVSELLRLSNLFILASRSESYSLSAQEAAIAGNLLVLNDDFTPMREIYGENALYFKFSSNMDRTSHRDGVTISEYQDIVCETPPSGFHANQVLEENGQWLINGEAILANHIASAIRNEFAQSKVLAQAQFRKKQRNIYAVFKQYLEPLFY